MNDAAGATGRDWLTSTWPFVHAHLPSVPAQVIEVGCGSSGGFVPALQSAGYQAIGVDPEAPEGPEYRRIEFERHDGVEPVDAVVACTSLHHVADLDEVVDRISSTLVPGGGLVVLEWAWERFDEATARWCFARIAATDVDHGWLSHHRDEWLASSAPWGSYLQGWAREHRLHSASDVIAALANRFDTQLLTPCAYLFPDLEDTSEADEQAATDAGVIQATGVRYVGSLRSA
ncbi:MAG: class I SAM-dependent methyltransferase [Nocardioidaceae bacterium]|nr:class I SAM-dependent methyltransferase [Nocardioidaceae bacterium]